MVCDLVVRSGKKIKGKKIAVILNEVFIFSLFLVTIYEWKSVKKPCKIN